MYEPIKLSETSDELKELYKSGYALAHMISRYNDDIYNDGSYLELQSYIKYVHNKDTFRHITCSSIKEGFAMKLYDIQNCFGTIFDARKADLLYTTPNLMGSFNRNAEGDRSARYLSIFYETDEIQNLSQNGFYNNGRYLVVPSDVSKEKNTRCLQAIDEGWRQIHKMGADKYYERTARIDPDVPSTTETIANIRSIKDTKAIIYNFENSYRPISALWEASPFHALAFKQFLKEKFEIDVPVVSYKWAHKQENVKFSEMHFEKEHVQEALNRSTTLPKTLNDLLVRAIQSLGTKANTDITVTSVDPIAGTSHQQLLS